MTDEALDIFWQARRCGESWTDLAATDEFLSPGDKLGTEATSTTAFKQFMFDLIKEMLSDIYQVRPGFFMSSLLIPVAHWLTDNFVE